MKRRVIISIYDDGLRIGQAISLIDKVGYDSTCFEKDFIWRFSDGHYVRADIAKNKESIKFDIWKGKE